MEGVGGECTLCAAVALHKLTIEYHVMPGLDDIAFGLFAFLEMFRLESYRSNQCYELDSWVILNTWVY